MKNFFSVFFLFLGGISLYCQGGYYDESLGSDFYIAAQAIGNPSVQPPDVAAFQKVNFVPVSNYTGRANISIPIYTVKAGSMSVPISLSYNSSGVKVSDMASNVGLNWSLNAGGVLSRMIKGRDDFHRPRKAASPIPFMEPSGWLGYMHPDVKIYGKLSRYNDAEPDLFVANAPGLSTKYIHSKHYRTLSSGIVALGGSPKPIELEHQGNIIEETIKKFQYSYVNANNQASIATNWGVEKVDITSISGIKYTFQSPDISVKNKGESNRLDRMFDASTNQTINFEYESYSNHFRDDTYSKRFPHGGGTGHYYGNDSRNSTYLITQRLKKITFEQGEVEFIYGHTRQDNIGEKALTEVKIKDNNGNLIKHVKMGYSYFQSNINSSTPQSKRLRLDRVYQVDVNFNELPGYEFEYDLSNQMPPRDSYAHDFLGYSNGTYTPSNSNPIPKFYVKASWTAPRTQNFELTPFNKSGYMELPGNYSLEANENHSKTYSLKKISYPTGGTNEYEYEINSFRYKGVEHIGGGIRIKSQKLDDGRGNQQILDYTYEYGSIARMPHFAVYRLKRNPRFIMNNSEILQVLGIDVFKAPQTQIELTQGSFVGYGKVTVRNRIDNGYTEYTYSSPSTNPNVNSIVNSSTPEMWKGIGPKVLTIDKDLMRGKILSEIVYTRDGKARSSKRYEYTQKTFSSISLDYLNKSTTVATDNCYSDAGVYSGSGGFNGNGNCGFYKEKVYLPVERNLLTKIISRDFQSKLLEGQHPDYYKNFQHTFKTEKTYEYAGNYPIINKERKEVIHCEEREQTTQPGHCVPINSKYDNILEKTMKYPFSSTLPLASNLMAKNRLSTIMEVLLKNRKGDQLANEKHYYKNFSVGGNNILALEKVNFIARDGEVTESQRIIKRDSKGKILEYQRKDGISVARIYGYENSDYLIAEIVNATYNDVINALNNSIQTPYNTTTFSNDVLIRQIMAELRNVLINTQITSYTYKKLVGINSVTDPRGRTTNYHYDKFNRLERITNHEGKVISKNVYNYKKQ